MDGWRNKSEGGMLLEITTLFSIWERALKARQKKKFWPRYLKLSYDYMKDEERVMI